VTTGLATPISGANAPCPRLGIIGGGQLAKMTAHAASRLGVEVFVLEKNRSSPALAVTNDAVLGDWDDPAALERFARRVDVITLENEFVDSHVLEGLETAGFTVRPSSKTLALTQDKLVQKQTLLGVGLPVPDFRAVNSVEELVQAASSLGGWPLVLKKRRNGYDGRGNATVRSAEEAPAAWSRLHGAPGALYAEAFCPFIAELAVMVCRGVDGSAVSYPVVESVQRDHVCHEVIAPARVAPAIAETARSFAVRAAEAAGMIGAMGVEMFLLADGRVLINELAPRVHNSGHYTIEGCQCSQFENHARAVLGWPLGSAAMTAPAAVMINLLGRSKGPGRPLGMEAALAVPGAQVHIYGKAHSGPGRKMGHVTALGANAESARAAALRAAEAIHFANE